MLVNKRAWVVGTLVISLALGDTTAPTRYTDWDPTSWITAGGILSIYPTISLGARILRKTLGANARS